MALDLVRCEQPQDCGFRRRILQQVGCSGRHHLGEEHERLDASQGIVSDLWLTIGKS